MAKLLELTDEMKQRVRHGHELAQALAGQTADFDPMIYPWNTLIHHQVPAWEELQATLNPQIEEYRQERERLKEVLYQALPESLRPLLPELNTVWVNWGTTQLDAVFLLGFVIGQRLHEAPHKAPRKQQRVKARRKKDEERQPKERAPRSG